MTRRARLRATPSPVIGGGQAGLSISWYLTQGGNRSRRVREGARRPFLARRALGYVLPGGRRTGNANCRAFLTPAATRTASCCATRLSRTWMRSSPRSRRRFWKGVAVRHLRADAQHGFMLEATDGIHFADQVVIASGGYQIPIIPRAAERLPDDVVRSTPRSTATRPRSPMAPCWSSAADNPGARSPRICISRAAKCIWASATPPRVARRYRGKDVVEWLHLMGYYDPPGARSSAARGRARQDQSLRHRPRRWPRYRSAPARARRHGALRQAFGLSAATASSL